MLVTRGVISAFHGRFGLKLGQGLCFYDSSKRISCWPSCTRHYHITRNPLMLALPPSLRPPPPSLLLPPPLKLMSLLLLLLSPPPTSPPTSPATQPPQRTPAAQLLLWRAPIAETPLTRDATTTVADIQSAGMVLVHHPHQQLVQEAHPLQEQQQKQAMIQGGKKRRAYGDADQHKVLKVLHTGVQQWPPHSHSTGVANNMQSSCSQMLRVYRFGALDGAIAAGTMLGKGGEGNVMSLRLPDTGQQVACKIPQSRLADGYLQDEQGYAGMIQHEHVSRLLGYGHVKPAMDV